MIYIFDRNDILLNIISEYNDFKHITKVNSIDSLSFSTNDIEYIERYNKVGFFNSNDEFQLFLIDDTDIEYTEGETTVSAECVSDLSVLRNNIIEDKRGVNGTVNVALEKALEDTEYKVGIIEQFESRDINFYFISSLEALNDILNTYLCEFNTRIEIDPESGVIKNKYIDIKHRLGEDTGLRFTYDVNLDYIQKSNITEGHFNVLYGRGKALETENGGYSRKLDFASANNGKKYVEDTESIAKYGRLEGIYENSDIEEPEVLLQKTLEKLQETKYPKYSYAVSIDDLSDIEGFEHYKVVKGDTISVLDEENDLVIEARVIEIEDNKKSKLLTLGNFIEGLSGNIDGEDIGSIKDKVDIIEKSPVDDSKYPDTLPDAPILSAKGLFSTIALEWTYENKSYYSYEVYASKIKDFNPDPTNRIFEGKASAFLHEVKPMQTWYYRARAKNLSNRHTEYSRQIEASTMKISDAAEYFEEAAIGHAIIASLDADKIIAGSVKGTYIDAKELTVTDGNGKRTLDIDSFGNVNLDVTNLKIASKSVATTENVKSEIDKVKEEANSYTNGQVTEINAEISKTNTKLAEIVTDVNSITQRVSDTETTTTTISATVSGHTSELNKVDGKINTAKTDAINTASSDATAKSNKAKDDANSYTNGAVASVNAEITSTNKKVAEIVTNVNSITQRVEDTEETTTNITATVNGHTNQLGLVDGKINTAKNDAIGTASADATSKSNKAKTDAQGYTDGKVTNINAEISKTNAKVATIETNVNSITQRVEDTEIETTKLDADIKSVDGKVTNVNAELSKTNSKVATIETNVNSITSRVGTTETNIININGTLQSHSQKIQEAEQKITPSAITSTVRNSNEYKNDLGDKVSQSQHSQLTQTVNDFKFSFKNSGANNLLRNSLGKNGESYWSWFNYKGGEYARRIVCRNNEWSSWDDCMDIRIGADAIDIDQGYLQKISVVVGKQYTFRALVAGHRSEKRIMFTNEGNSSVISNQWTGGHIGGGSEWVEVILTFTATERFCNLRLGFTRSYDGDGYIWLREMCLVEGDLTGKWTSHASEVYEGVTTIDGQGVAVAHTDGYKSRLSASCLEFLNSNEKQAMAMTKGGVEFIDERYDERIGFMKSSRINDSSCNGITLASSSVGDYISLGSFTGTDYNNWSVTPMITCIPRSMDGLAGGFAGVMMYPSVKMQNGLIFPSENIEYPHQIQGVGGGNLGVYGDNGVSLGCKEGANLISRLKYLESETKWHNYAHWDFHNWDMWNMISKYSLSSTTTKTYTETTNIQAEEKEVRFVFEDMQIKDSKAVISIPNRYIENMSRYRIVGLAKKGRGDIWISEELEQRFIIEAEQDIKFNCEISIVLKEPIQPYNVKQQIDIPVEVENVADSTFVFTE